MAEGAFRQAAEKAGLDCSVESAGTAAYHIGEAPDPRAIAVAGAHDVDISEASGQQLNAQDFTRFTHIFALDKANLAGIKSRAPQSTMATIAMLMDTVPGREGQDVPDPYYGDERDFANVWREVSGAAEILVARLQEAGSDANF